MRVIYILLMTEAGMEHEVAEKISKMEHVTETHVTYGEWDIVVRVEIGELGKELDELVTKIRRTRGVIKSMTLISTG
ncbi:MAG: Lrp/AsnC ligand binding domain-containing protein [Candidatus Jordarchaeales archaeon]|nr:Lrp/AsnC ligand binding domain-containing protein [Candidatus Jordarchaeia archaeon]